MLVALDSNVIIYAEALVDDPRNQVAHQLVENLSAQQIVVPLQAAGETLRWLIGRAKMKKSDAVKSVIKWTTLYRTQATTLEVWQSAQELISVHNLQVWDAVILAAANEAQASLLLSEDMQDGFRWRGVTVANPFAEAPIGLVRDLVAKNPT